MTEKLVCTCCMYPLYHSVLYIETQRDIHQCATDELVNAGMDGIHLR